MKLCSGTGEDCLNCKLEKCIYEMDTKERHSKTYPSVEEKVDRRGRPKETKTREVLDSKPYNDICNIITEHRKKMGMSQTEMGELLGLNKNTIFRYENGLIYPQMDVAARILDILGMEIVIQKKRAKG